ncbi:MAG: DNA translocase FtsK 4TM domain-containing protein, partial [Sphingomonadales bacterium]|nr:DNA translocase FtsK 4TM domain-containing protein [Sphingomonadales bacterium]
MAAGAAARPHWRAVLRRSARRSGELLGASALFAAMLFLGLALASYHQTDPSPSTAAGGAVANWMGLAGAWAAERALFLFGPVSILFLPLLYVFARKLWRYAEEDENDLPHSHQRWLRPLALLLIAMLLLASVLSLTFTQPGGSLPASMGGIAGLLGADALRAGAGLLPAVLRGWVLLGVGLACLAAGALLAGRVFAVDWVSLLTLPHRLHRAARPASEAPALAAPRPRKAAEPGPAVAVTP